MNSFEEFNNYCLSQISEIGNQVYFEELKEEDIDFVKKNEKECNIVIDINNSNNRKEIRRKESLGKRLKSYPKNYQTYPLEYKKYIIKIVNKLLILFIIL
jgi:predicted transcriptional regulator